jgi:low temperature requirement protein LtrA
LPERSTLPSIAAFLACFVGSALMWWIYFDRGAQRGAQHIARNAEAGRIARSAYLSSHADRRGRCRHGSR